MAIQPHNSKRRAWGGVETWSGTVRGSCHVSAVGEMGLAHAAGGTEGVVAREAAAEAVERLRRRSAGKNGGNRRRPVGWLEGRN